MHPKLEEFNEEYKRLYKRMQQYQSALMQIEGRRIEEIQEFVCDVLNQYIPHRSCPNCFEDCIGWVVERRPCDKGVKK